MPMIKLGEIYYDQPISQLKDISFCYQNDDDTENFDIAKKIITALVDDVIVMVGDINTNFFIKIKDDFLRIYLKNSYPFLGYNDDYDFLFKFKDYTDDSCILLMLDKAINDISKKSMASLSTESLLNLRLFNNVKYVDNFFKADGQIYQRCCIQNILNVDTFLTINNQRYRKASPKLSDDLQCYSYFDINNYSDDEAGLTFSLKAPNFLITINHFSISLKFGSFNYDINISRKYIECDPDTDEIMMDIIDNNIVEKQRSTLSDMFLYFYNFYADEKCDNVDDCLILLKMIHI